MHLRKLEKYPLIVNSQDLIKCLGIFLITLDHISSSLVYVPIFSVLGNIGAPLFFFVAGLHIPKRIHWEYLAVGLLLTGVTYLAYGYWFGNILLSFFVIKLILYKFPSLFTSYWSAPLAVLPMFAQPVNLLYFDTTFFEYGGFGVSYSLTAQFRKHKQLFGTLLWCIVLTAHYAWMHLIPRNVYTLPFDSQSLSFSVSSYQEIIPVIFFYLSYALMGVIIILYKHREFSTPNYLKLPIILVSRYSLHIYALQILLFSALK